MAKYQFVYLDHSYGYLLSFIQLFTYLCFSLKCPGSWESHDRLYTWLYIDVSPSDIAKIQGEDQTHSQFLSVHLKKCEDQHSIRSPGTSLGMCCFANQQKGKARVIRAEEKRGSLLSTALRMSFTALEAGSSLSLRSHELSTHYNCCSIFDSMYIKSTPVWGNKWFLRALKKTCNILK